MRELWVCFSGLIAACALSACAQSSPPSESSETHFLMRCEQSCADGFECICGVCTQTCASRETCAGLPKGVQCLEAVGSCTSGALCDLECERDIDCHELSKNHVCEDSRCRAPAATTDDDDASTQPNSSESPPAGDDGGMNEDASAWSCNLDGVFEDLLQDALQLEDCGSYMGPANDIVDAKAAIDCVRAAIAAGRSFKVVWWPDSLEEKLAYALVRRVQLDVDAYWSIQMLEDTSGDPGMQSVVSWTRCPGFSLADECVDDLEACLICSTSAMDTSCECRNELDNIVCDEPRVEDERRTCELDAVATQLVLEGRDAIDCGTLGLDATSEEQSDAIACVRAAIDSIDAFRLIWQTEGEDSRLMRGLVGYFDLDYFATFTLSFDGFGVVSDRGTALASWAPCGGLTIADDCSDLSTCFNCEPNGDYLCECGPSPTTGALETHCDEPGGSEREVGPPPCQSETCDFFGVCYPLGVTDESGCCTCNEDGGVCSAQASCDGQASIGKRCEGDGDCSLGLECRSDFAGEQGVCTRPCNSGCPTGTECVAEVPTYDDGFATDMCMRPCIMNADCFPIGSVCTQLATPSERYCF